MEEYNKKFPFIRATISLLLFLVGGLLLTAFVAGVISAFFPETKELIPLRITIALQNILTFAMPAVLVALLFADNKWEFLSLNKNLNLRDLLLGIALYLIASPAINFIIALNQAVVLPEWMAEFEAMLKASEEAAKAMTDKLLADRSFFGIAGTILVIGILTGFGEEIFFRGALMGIFSKIIKNKHLIIWLTAFIFSAFHLQFYGLVPRMILGAIFGYTLYWSRCLWIPIILHAINNSAVVLFPENQMENKGLEDMLNFADIAFAAVSTGLAIALMVYWNSKSNKEHKERQLL